MSTTQSSSKPRMRVKNGEVLKQSSENVPTSRIHRSEVGYQGLLIRSLQGRLASIEEEEVRDLSWPHLLDTYSAMLKDDAVAVAMQAKETLILKALGEANIAPGDPEDEASVAAAEFVQWCLNNMEETFYSTMENICTYNTFGFSVFEKVYSTVPNGEYQGRQYLKKLSPRSQKSLDTSAPFNYSEDGRTFLGINQSRRNLPRLNSLPHGRFGGLATGRSGSSGVAGGFDNRSDVISIPANKLVIFAYRAHNGSRQGNSPLKSVYVAWKEKKIIEEYQTIGITKDLGGLPVLELPIEMLNKAAQDTNSNEASVVRDLQRDVANMHAGDQSYMILPSDTDEKGNKLFKLTLMGVEGSGKQFDLQGAIKSRKQAILDAFGAGFMSLGNDGGGSYAMMDGKTSVHEAFVERDIKFITDVFESQVFPQLLAINGIKLTEKQMPKMQTNPISEVDPDTWSKVIQRTASVGFLPKTVKLTNELIEKLGLDSQLDPDMTDEELVGMSPENTSRAGDGMQEGMPSGTGSATGGGDSSISNNENGGS